MTTGDMNLKNARAEFEPVLNTLYTVDLSDPEAVSKALVGFYDKVQHVRENAHKGPQPDDVIRSINEAITEKLEVEFVKALKNAAPVSREDEDVKKEIERFRALTGAFNALGRTLDQIDHKRTRKNTHPFYHDNGHNLLVMAIRLVRELNKWQEQGEPVTIKDVNDLLRDLIASENHDSKHNGSNNTIVKAYIAGKLEITDRGYKAGRLELLSNAVVQKQLVRYGVPKTDRDFIKWELLATDFEVPAEIVLYAYKRHMNENVPAASRKEIEKKIEALPEKSQRSLLYQFMRTLEGNKELTEAAMTLKGCDMVPSYGLGEAMWKKMCSLFHKENIVLKPNDPVVDENGKPIDLKQLFVTLCLTGAQRANGNGGPNNGQEWQAVFYDPSLQKLFGRSLENIKAAAWKNTPPEIVEKIIAPLRSRLPALTHG